MPLSPFFSFLRYNFAALVLLAVNSKTCTMKPRATPPCPLLSFIKSCHTNFQPHSSPFTATAPKPTNLSLYRAQMAFSAPNSDQIVKFLFAATLGSVPLLISGLSCTATVIFLVMATPALVFFSPILVPAGIVISLVISGFILSGGLAVTALPALSWIWKHLPLFRSDQLEYARKRIENFAGEALKRMENLTGEANDENEEKAEEAAAAVAAADEEEEEEKAEEVTEAS